MEALYARCCGLDVHKSSITACVLITQAGKPLKHIRRFGSTTRELRELAEWLREFAVEHVAMESTGVYWKPVWNVLEGDFQIVLPNAQHIKAVPGRKTDTKDCQWIAELLQHGLLRASYIPSVLICDLRDLTRGRTSLSQEHSRIASRIQKVLEDANIKLASVASNALGKSGRAMLGAIIEGEESSERLADLALGHLRAKIPQLQTALEGHVRDHHRFLLRGLLRQLQFLEAEIALLDARLDQIGREHPDLAEALDRWITVPGVDLVAAWSFIAEMGTDVSQFPSAAHLASWAGVCPGNNESAGKRLSSKTRKGSPWLRRMACQSAWAAARTKNTYLSSQFKRLAARRGRKCAIIAVAHSILVIGYHLQQRSCTYTDLGSSYFDRLHADGLKRYLVKRLEKSRALSDTPTPHCMMKVFSREKAGLQTGCGVRSQVIDVLRGTRDKRRPAMKKVSTAAAKQSRNISRQRLTIGLDLGDRNSWYCVLDEAGQIQREQRVRTTAKALGEVFGAMPRSRIALEIGTHSPWISRLLSELGHEVIVANARKVQLSGESRKKDDRLDAQTLARLARIDPELLYPVKHRSAQAQADLMMIRARAGLVRARTGLVNTARGLAKSYGERLRGCNVRDMDPEKGEGLSPELQRALEPLLATLSERILEYNDRIEALAQTSYPQVALLKQIKGVGTLIALTFLLTLEDPHRFRKSRDVGGYLGLQPGRRKSGQSEPQLHISKEGDPYLRTLLVQGGQHILGPFGIDCDLRRWGLKLAERGGRSGKKRAIVATARKLAVLLHHLWVSGEVYDPLHNNRATVAAAA